MAKKAQKPKRKKGQRKKFFEAEIPLISTKIHLYSYSPEELEGSTVTIDLSKTLRGKNMELKSKLKLKNEKLMGELSSLQLISSYLKRVMRRGTDYVEDSFKTECKDAKLQVKPFLITRKRVPRSVRKAIRETARKHLQSHITLRTVKEVFSEIMTNKMQKGLSLKVKKIYPLALCEIRMIKVLEEKKLERKRKQTKETPKEKDAEKEDNDSKEE